MKCTNKPYGSMFSKPCACSDCRKVREIDTLTAYHNVQMNEIEKSINDKMASFIFPDVMEEKVNTLRRLKRQLQKDYDNRRDLVRKVLGK